MNSLTYKIAAMTDVGLVRTNNEDNLCVISNLDQKGSTWRNNEVCSLGSRGALLVVADGMGGMNAGEVASEIAISVVKSRFTDYIDSVDLASDESIVRFMNDSIVIADNTIKNEGKHRPETKGMGTTIVIAWLLYGKLYVSWCGDSRAYLFNPHRGLTQISKDHSYVQELVDKGVVKPEDAFDFPESNVITRCLSHSSMKAVPENLPEPYRVGEGDIVMLCTDGLCGMIRDNEIADVMARHTDDMSVCVESLIEAAKVAAGADNVTVCLCQILGENGQIIEASGLRDRTDSDLRMEDKPRARKKSKKTTAILLVVLPIIAILLTVVFIQYTLPVIKSYSKENLMKNMNEVEQKEVVENNQANKEKKAETTDIDSDSKGEVSGNKNEESESEEKKGVITITVERKEDLKLPQKQDSPNEQNKVEKNIDTNSQKNKQKGIVESLKITKKIGPVLNSQSEK